MTALMTPSGMPISAAKTQGQPRDPGGDRDARQDLGEGRSIGHVGIAEVALQQSADPTRILDRHRLVEAEVLHDLRLLGRVDEARGVEQDVGDVARGDPQHHKDDHRDPEQCQEHQAETPHQIGCHGSPPSPAAWRFCGASTREDSMRSRPVDRISVISPVAGCNLSLSRLLLAAAPAANLQRDFS